VSKFAKMSFGDVVQSIAQEEPKQHPMKHGLKDDFTLLYWNAHCQFWQRQKPVSLSLCGKAYGDGPFVHGYHAPVPWGGTGTGVGWWHQDKKKWLLWEPEPLETTMEAAAKASEPVTDPACGFRRKSATHSDLKSAGDSDLKPATCSDPSRPPIPI